MRYDYIFLCWDAKLNFIVLADKYAGQNIKKDYSDYEPNL